jgi:hypothetical protein
MRHPGGKPAARIVAVGLNVPATLDVLGSSRERPMLERLLTVVSGW